MSDVGHGGTLQLLLPVSVIVCTRNRAESLSRCLASIIADASTAPAEIVVVDNGSTDHTSRAIADAADTSRREVIHVVAEQPGHSRARNAGIRAACGHVLVFTDDDVTVQSGWIDAISAPFADPRVGGVGGRILPTFLAPRPDWISDDELVGVLTLWDHGSAPFEFEGSRLPLGANMALRASVLPPCPFNVLLGHTGRVALGFDETYLCRQLLRTHRLVYAPTAIVSHLLDASRLDFSVARRMAYHHGFGGARYQRLTDEGRARFTRRAAGFAKAWIRVPLAAARHPEAKLRAWSRAGYTTERLVGHRAPALSMWLARRL